MNMRNGIMRKSCVYLLVVLIAFSMCFAATGCGNTAPSAAESSAATDATSSAAPAEDTSSAAEAEEPKADPLLENTKTARTETHYALYYANKDLSKLTYLDAEYNDLKTTYDKAARAWYKGQYYMDLVTCGEITQEGEVKQYLEKAVAYFSEAKTDANSVSEALKS